MYTFSDVCECKVSENHNNKKDNQIYKITKSMKTKLFLSLFAVAGMLLATACQNDSLESIQADEDGISTVTFAVGVEGNVSTRAISDGSGIDKLVYAVFKQDDGVAVVEKTEVDVTSFPYTLTLHLVTGITYDIVFWAQNSNCTAYTVSDDMSVKIDYTSAANDETRDAFFKTEAFTPSASSTNSLSVTLTRPFAQVNVGVTKDDYNAAVASGVDIAKSRARLRYVADSLDLRTGKAMQTEANVQTDFTLDVIPTETLTVTENGVATEYIWLSMNYILVADGSDNGEDKSTLTGFFLYLYSSEDDVTYNYNRALIAVPVQRNYRTNILGSFLSTEVNVTVSLDTNFDNDNKYPENEWQALLMAAYYGGTYTLTENMDMNDLASMSSSSTYLQRIFVIAGPKSPTFIDLNGYEITNSAQSDTQQRLIFVSQGELIISDSSVDGTGKVTGGSGSLWNSAVWAYNGGTVYIEGGTYTVEGNRIDDGTTEAYVNPTVLIWNDDETEGTTYGQNYVYISGGTFTTGAENDPDCILCSRRAGQGEFILTGGTFIGFNPLTSPNSDTLVTIPDGYTVVTDGIDTETGRTIYKVVASE